MTGLPRTNISDSPCATIRTTDYLIVGGCDHQVGRESSQGRFDEIENWVRERFTKAGAVDYKWSGQINEPIYFMGFIRKNQGCDNIYIATGDSGNGLTHDVIARRLIADEIEGKDNPWGQPLGQALLAKAPR